MINFKSPIAPLYSTLSNVQVVLDATGLRDGVENSYGKMTSGVAGVVQIWKSISPGAAIEFTANPVGLSGDNSVLRFFDGYIEFPGYTVMTYNNVSPNFFSFLNYASPVGNLKSTVHMVIKVGQDAHPNLFYGFFGSNAGSAGNKGDLSGYDDRILVPRS